jgi:hypothetical protein
MGGAWLLASIELVILIVLAKRGLQYYGGEFLDRKYHLWTIQTDDAEPCYLGSWDDSYFASEAAEQCLRDQNIVSILVRKPSGARLSFTSADMQRDNGIYL